MQFSQSPPRNLKEDNLAPYYKGLPYTERKKLFINSVESPRAALTDELWGDPERADSWLQ